MSRGGLGTAEFHSRIPPREGPGTPSSRRRRSHMRVPASCVTVQAAKGVAASLRHRGNIARDLSSTASRAAMFWMSYESDARRLLSQLYLPQAVSLSLLSAHGFEPETPRVAQPVQAHASKAPIPPQLLREASAPERRHGDDWVSPSGRGGDGGDPLIEKPPFRVEAPGYRIIAIGDLHGDFEVTKAALRLGGVLSPPSRGAPEVYEEDLRWTGGNTLVVQVGDILDRGGDEIAIMSLLRHLDTQARAQGGRVFQLNGNHETLNVGEDFRYVADEGFHECQHFLDFTNNQCGGNWRGAFRDWWRQSQAIKVQSEPLSPWATWNPLQMRRLVRMRSELFQVGGPMALELSRHGVALMVNDTLFAHGGVLPHHVLHGLDKMNEEVSRWMRRDLGVFGEPEPMPFIATRGFDSIVWSRLYSQEYYATPDDKAMACAVLSGSLDALGAKRLVVGHTPQIGGANSECQGRVWRIDVGMASGMMGAPPQVLEIEGDSVRVLGGQRDRLKVAQS